MVIKTIGFPKIKNFGGDIRDFLPSLFQYLKKFDNIELFAESGYGLEVGLTENDYLSVNPIIQFVNSEEVYKQDLTLILKMPELEELEKLKDGCSIFTMCHYPTRPAYVELFKHKSINAISMDSIVDDYGKRLFVDYFRTAYNGAQLAFDELKKSMNEFYSANRNPINITILGVGPVAQNCAKSYEILSDEAFLDNGIPGVIVRLLPRTITYSEELLIPILKDTDILVDATNRKDSSKCVIRNELLAHLPKHSIIHDITADRYDNGQVRPIEGTVLGSLSKTIIYSDDELYNKIPKYINSSNRRTTVSCNAWPGVTPKDSISFYEVLIKDYLNILLTKDINDIDKESSNFFERALYRGTLSNYLNQNL
jgi:alanine dehydrogenase